MRLIVYEWDTEEKGSDIYVSIQDFYNRKIVLE